MQLIKYDINVIKNPVKFAQELMSKNELEKHELMNIVSICGKEDYLFERRYFEFQPSVSSCVLLMIMVSFTSAATSNVMLFERGIN